MRMFTPSRLSLNQAGPAYRQAGDTIIEVLLSISILALVLTVAYQSTSRSLQNGIDSSNRQQALALAEQQVEIIKNAAANSSGPGGALSAYQYTAAAYCVDPTPPAITTSPLYGRSATTAAACHLINNVYDLSDTYSGGLFTIKANWPSTVAGSSGKSQLTLYYR